METLDVMLKVRAVVAKSGLTYMEIGLRMGYPPKSARQSAWQFLKSTNPTINVLVRFAKAMGVSVEKLL